MSEPPDWNEIPCPASREAVAEREAGGEQGCPICGAAAEAHQSEEQGGLGYYEDDRDA